MPHHHFPKRNGRLASHEEESGEQDQPQQTRSREQPDHEAVGLRSHALIRQQPGIVDQPLDAGRSSFKARKPAITIINESFGCQFMDETPFSLRRERVARSADQHPLAPGLESDISIQSWEREVITTALAARGSRNERSHTIWPAFIVLKVDGAFDPGSHS